MTRPRLIAVAAAALALVAAGAVPANAERTYPRDAKKDVVAVNIMGPEANYVPVPGNKNTDVVRTVLRHSPNRVIARTDFRDLDRSTGFAIYQIRTDKGDYQAMQLLGSEDGLIFAPALARAMGVPPEAARVARDGGGAEGRFVLMGMNGEVVCDDLWYYSHVRQDRARMSIARSCLGNPKWVRIGAGVVSATYAGETPYLVVDDVLRNGLELEALTMSRRLHRP